MISSGEQNFNASQAVFFFNTIPVSDSIFIDSWNDVSWEWWRSDDVISNTQRPQAKVKNFLPLRDPSCLWQKCSTLNLRIHHRSFKRVCRVGAGYLDYRLTKDVGSIPGSALIDFSVRNKKATIKDLSALRSEFCFVGLVLPLTRIMRRWLGWKES